MKTKLSLLALFLTLGRLAQALTVPVASDTYSKTSGTTAYVYPLDATTTSLPVNAKETAFLSFDLSNLEVVPATVKTAGIDAAILELYIVNAAPAGDLTLHALTSPLTFQFVKGKAPAPDIDPTILATIPATEVAKKTFVTVDITPIIAAALQSGSFNGLAIEASGATKVTLTSKEGPAIGYAAVLDLHTVTDTSPITLSIGTVTSGSTAAVSLTGTSSSRALNFVLPIGAKGDAGATGSTGSQGPQGTQGAQGTQGSAGPAGATGAMGATGSTGSQGPIGLTGSAGATGPQGPTGVQGPAGPADNISVGTISTGTASSLTITGSAPNQVINIAFPNGQLPNENTGLGAVALNHITASTIGDTGFGNDALTNDTGSGKNSAFGDEALAVNTSGFDNEAFGYQALFANDSGDSNIAIGIVALRNNTSGRANIAIGNDSLNDNITGFENIAIGYNAMMNNDSGDNNVAIGLGTLFANTTGQRNSALGGQALSNNTTGINNAAFGFATLISNIDGFQNAAFGYNALASNLHGVDNVAIGSVAFQTGTAGTYNVAVGAFSFWEGSGDDNTAIGHGSLSHVGTFSNNIALGSDSGDKIQLDNNICIGNEGAASDTGIIRIGTDGTHVATLVAGIYGTIVSGGTPVFILSNGQLGTVTSSRRFKTDIAPMAASSDVLLSLNPVTFKYKPGIDPKGIPQYGLIAEDVEKVAPSLVIHDAQNRPYTVRYEQINAMLLNEFLKEHQRVKDQGDAVAAQGKTIAGLTRANAELQKAVVQQEQKDNAIATRLKSVQALKDTISEQQKEIEALTESMEKMTQQIEKVAQRLDGKDYQPVVNRTGRVAGE